MRRRGKKRRCAVLGVDGLSHDTLLKLVSAGIMPATADLMRQGVLRRMRATLPEISSVSWTSFMTGKNPGRHGIFGFVDLLPGSYRLHFPNSMDLKSPTVFDRLAKEDRRVAVLNLPGTYPARPFPGVLVCGFVALDLEKAVYPNRLLPYLREIGYRIDVDASKGKHNNAEFLSELNYSLCVKRQLLHKIWLEEEWDLFVLVVTETDRLQHFFYNAIGNPRHPCHEQTDDFFRQLDELVADMIRLVDKEDECPLFLLSDHGFYPLKQEVNLNPLLRKAGFGGARVNKDFTGIEVKMDCKAFAVDPSRIFVHERGRFPGGGVKRGDVQSVKEELRAFLLELKFNGEHVIQEVFDKKDLYQGPQTHRAADLILLSREGYDVKGGLSREETYTLGNFTGMHGYRNAFFYSSDSGYLPDCGSGSQDFSIEDAAEPILKALGVAPRG